MKRQKQAVLPPLDTLSLADLEALRKAVEAQAVATERAVVLDVAMECRRIIQASGVPIRTVTAILLKPSIAGGMSPRGKARKKAGGKPDRKTYRDPDDVHNSWAGQGRYPTWLKSKLAAGHKIEEFEV